jgi:hypothetical protein
MNTNKIRHLAVALCLVAVAGVTAASAAGLTRHVPRTAQPAGMLPVPDGDLGEIVVHAPGDLGEVIVHAPHDLGEVLVNVHREPAPGEYLAQVVVTVPRASAAPLASEAEAMVAAAD